MNSLLEMALSNAVIAAILAVTVFAVSRRVHRPALIHGLWLVVLLKLITPPVVSLPIEVAWWDATQAENPTRSKPSPALRIPDVNPVSTRRDAATATKPGARGNLLPRQTGSENVAGDPDFPMFSEFTSSDSTTGAKETIRPVPTANVDLSPPTSMPEPTASQPLRDMEHVAKRGADSPNPAGNSVGEVSETPSEQPVDVTAEQAVSTATESEPRGEWNRNHLLNAVIAVWLSGSVFYGILLLIRVMYFRHVLRQAVRAPESLQQETAELAAGWGMSRVPEVFLLPGAVSPMLWAGGFHPRVLFPRELLGRMEAEGRSTLLLHELAHLRRGDHWVRMIELLGTCLLWWNPVLWWARREIHLAEEQCCDALVVEQSADGGRTYANALLDTIDFLADTRSVLPPAASGIGHVDFVKRRLVQILQGTVAGRISTPARSVILIVAVLLLPLLPTFARPPASQASTTAAETVVATKPPPKGSPLAETEGELPLPAPQPPNIGSGEPLDFATRSRSLQFEPLEIRTMALSPDGTLLATGHGRWTTAGAVRIRNLKIGKNIAVFPEQKGDCVGQVFAERQAARHLRLGRDVDHSRDEILQSPPRNSGG